MDKGTRWSSQLAFYILAIGSAFGLGNLWRFPFVVGSNGGGAFILLYLFLLFVIGLPLIIAELMMGKAERGSVIHVTRRLSRQAGPWVRWVGWGAFALSVVVFGYYSIISGWVLFYISQFLRQIVEPSGILEPAALFENVWLQISLVSVHLLFLGFVVSKGIKEGIEKLAVFVMPVFILMLGMILYRTLSLPSVSGALRFLFYPDFRELGWTSLAHAIGHVFFTLGVGFGVLVTFSSYLREEEYVPGLGLRVAVMDAVASLSAVLIIFPVVFLAADTSISHPALMFEVLPRFILGLPYGN
ncbi:MAG: sodium-dependent transporter, partial [Bdellovibrionaceae bacterium]|nr:sodium-dependent transporter [Pseudobdellovibrionaceae bacterium]